MRGVLRLLPAVMVATGIFGLAGPAAAAPVDAAGTGDGCAPSSTASYVYTPARWTVRFRLTPCDGTESMAFSTQVQRLDADGNGVTGFSDGVAPCPEGVCVVTTGLVHASPEAAGYDGFIVWGNGRSAQAERVWCRTGPNGAACRPAPGSPGPGPA